MTSSIAPRRCVSQMSMLPHASLENTARSRQSPRARVGASSFLVHLPDDRPPQALFAANELAGLRRREVARVGAERLKPLDHLRDGHDLAQVGVDLLDDVLGRA